MTNIIATDDNFDDLIQQTQTPLVIDVWAPWCGPCKMVGPILTRIAESDTAHFTLAMANMEEFAQTAEKFNVKATPTLLIFHHGEEIARRSGAMMKSQIEQWLTQHIDE